MGRLTLFLAGITLFTLNLGLRAIIAAYPDSSTLFLNPADQSSYNYMHRCLEDNITCMPIFSVKDLKAIPYTMLGGNPGTLDLVVLYDGQDNIITSQFAGEMHWNDDVPIWPYDFERYEIIRVDTSGNSQQRIDLSNGFMPTEITVDNVAEYYDAMGVINKGVPNIDMQNVDYVVLFNVPQPENTAARMLVTCQEYLGQYADMNLDGIIYG